MNKFWQWMKENGYVRIGDRHAGIYFDQNTFGNEGMIWYDSCACADIGVSLPKQMLIGYMLEYIQGRKLNTIEQQIFLKRMVLFIACKDIYEVIAEFINWLDGEE
jgi:hypothetical protein